MSTSLTQIYNMGALTASSATVAIDLQNMSKISFQVTQSASGVDWDGTIEESNDGVAWMPTSDTVNMLASGSFMVDRVDVCARYCRLNLAKTTGNLSDVVVVFNGKF